MRSRRRRLRKPQKVLFEERDGAGFREVQKILQVRDAQLIMLEHRREQRFLVGSERRDMPGIPLSDQKTFRRLSDGFGADRIKFKKSRRIFVGGKKAQAFGLLAPIRRGCGYEIKKSFCAREGDIEEPEFVVLVVARRTDQ